MNAAFSRSALAMVSIIILALTLTPVHGSGAVTVAVDLLAFRGAADALSNILLFVPFGVCAALSFRGRLAPIAAGIALSAFIELAQLAIPGRFVSSTDIVFNGAGTAAGVLLVRFSDLWMCPGGWLRSCLAVTAMGGAMTALLAGGSLLVPEIPVVVLYGQWTAEFEDMASYGGEVIAARVGMVRAPSRRIIASDSLRAHLMRGEELRLDVIAGAPPSALAPIFSIYDEYEREMMLVGADHDDLVLRYRMRATSSRFDQPDIRVTDALAGVVPGSTFVIRVSRKGRGYCIAVDGNVDCGVGFTLADTWSLLLYPVPRAVVATLRFAWVGLLVIPAGFWLRRIGYVVAAWGVVSLFLMAGPTIVGVLDSPPATFLSAVIGLFAGYLLGRSACTRSTTPRSGRFAHTPGRI